LGSFRIFFDVLDDVDQIRDFREEGVIISESDSCLIVVSRLPNIKDRLNVGVNKPRYCISSMNTHKIQRHMLQAVSIRVDFEFTAIIMSLKSNDVGKASYGSTVILPDVWEKTLGSTRQ
jgi:hypothetical protein